MGGDSPTFRDYSARSTSVWPEGFCEDNPLSLAEHTGPDGKCEEGSAWNLRQCSGQMSMAADLNYSSICKRGCQSKTGVRVISGVL